MVTLKRRIEKAEDKVESMEKETSERKARLLEMQNNAEDNSLGALLLQLELEHGREFTLADIAAMAGIRE